MATALKRLSLSDYPAQEIQAGVKHEFYRGELFAMVGGTPEHSLITTNFLRESSMALKDRPCVPYNGNLRIKVEDSGLYTYPDASIFCGELQLDEVVPNTALNPTVLVEVLSESTERYDRGQKSAFYRRIPSLKELVLISQDNPLVECYKRQESGWLLIEATKMDQELVLISVGVTIPLAELYRNVSFDLAQPSRSPIVDSAP